MIICLENIHKTWTNWKHENNDTTGNKKYGNNVLIQYKKQIRMRKINTLELNKGKGCMEVKEDHEAVLWGRNTCVDEDDDEEQMEWAVEEVVVEEEVVEEEEVEEEKQEVRVDMVW